jgi:hypothetical protein
LVGQNQKILVGQNQKILVGQNQKRSLQSSMTFQ